MAIFMYLKSSLAELIQGAHSEKNLEVIREFVEAFTIIGESADTWLGRGKAFLYA